MNFIFSTAFVNKNKATPIVREVKPTLNIVFKSIVEAFLSIWLDLTIAYEINGAKNGNNNKPNIFFASNFIFSTAFVNKNKDVPMAIAVKDIDSMVLIDNGAVNIKIRLDATIAKEIITSIPDKTKVLPILTFFIFSLI